MFPGPDSMRFVWAGVGRALMQFMHFSAIFGMLAVLATLVTPWYPPRVCEWGYCDNICLLGYRRTFFAVCSCAEGRSNARANYAKWLFRPIMA